MSTRLWNDHTKPPYHGNGKNSRPWIAPVTVVHQESCPGPIDPWNFVCGCAADMIGWHVQLNGDGTVERFSGFDPDEEEPDSEE